LTPKFCCGWLNTTSLAKRLKNPEHIIPERMLPRPTSHSHGKQHAFLSTLLTFAAAVVERLVGIVAATVYSVDASREALGFCNVGREWRRDEA
jgi:hypothetical protein